MLTCWPRKAEVVAVLALSWTAPCRGAFVGPPPPSSFVTRPHKGDTCVTRPVSGRGLGDLQNAPLVVRLSVRVAQGAEQRRSAGGGRVNSADDEGLGPLILLSLPPPVPPDEIHDSILEAYVPPLLVTKSFEPPRPSPPEPPRNESNRSSSTTSTLGSKGSNSSSSRSLAAASTATTSLNKATSREVVSSAPKRKEGTVVKGSWWGKDLWGFVTGRGVDKGKQAVAAARKEGGGGGKIVGKKKRRRRRRGLKDGHHMDEDFRKLLRKKKKEALASLGVAPSGKGKRKGASSSRRTPAARRPSSSVAPAPPPSPAWSRAVKWVVESPSVSWITSRFKPSPTPPPSPRSSPPLSPPLSPAPLLQRVMDPKSVRSAPSPRGLGRGRELRPDDLVKLPRNVEEAWDTFLDDTRHFMDSLYRVLVPDPSRLEPPPVRPRVGLERPKAKRQRIGALNAKPLALRQMRPLSPPTPPGAVSSSGTGKLPSKILEEQRAAKAGMEGTVAEEEEEEGEDYYDDEDYDYDYEEDEEEGGDWAALGLADDYPEETEEDWAAKVQRSMEAAKEEEAEGRRRRRELLPGGGDDGAEVEQGAFVMRYPLAFPNEPRRQVADSSSPPSAPQIIPSSWEAARQVVLEGAAARQQKDEGEEESTGLPSRGSTPPTSPSSSPPSSPPRQPLVLPVRQKGWLDSLLAKIFSSPDRAIETQRRRQLIKRVPRRMDERFLRTVSRKLQGDRLRIREFQLQTDRFRNSLITAQAYYDSVLLLFGSVQNAEEVLLPLINTLPEQSKRRDLADIYKAKREKAREGRGVEDEEERRQEEEREQGEDGKEPSSGGLRATVAGAVGGIGGWVSAGAGWTRNAISAIGSTLIGNRTLEISIETDDDVAVKGRRGRGSNSDNRGMEVVVVPPAEEVFERTRGMLGERNLAYLSMRIDSFKRGAITAADFYRSVQRLCGPLSKVEVVMEELEGVLATSAPRPWSLLKQVHEGQTRTVTNNNNNNSGKEDDDGEDDDLRASR